jgi:hypothetical protein
MASKQVFENKDLLIHIYSFGTDEHRKFTKTILQTNVYTSKVTRQYLKSRNDNMWLFEKKDTIFPQLQMFFHFKRCHCCSRHSHRKPDIVVKKGRILYLTDYGPRVPEDKEFINQCECMCRHECRYIVRTLEDKINYLP